MTSLLQSVPAGARLFTVKEVAAELRVSTATVHAMVKRGELEHVRVSNSIRIVWGGVGRGMRTAAECYDR